MSFPIRVTEGRHRRSDDQRAGCFVQEQGMVGSAQGPAASLGGRLAPSAAVFAGRQAIRCSAFANAAQRDNNRV